MISFSQSVYSINYFLLLQLKQGGRGEGGGGLSPALVISSCYSRGGGGILFLVWLVTLLLRTASRWTCIRLA